MEALKFMKKSTTVKKIIDNLQGKDKNSIVSELINNNYYLDNVCLFYHFFGLEGGTVWQLANYILFYKTSFKNTIIFK